MSTFGPLIDTFERLMAAVAFAEQDDRETACWIMKPESRQAVLRVNEENRPQATNRPELRL
jgi:hypothetical protein